MLAVWRRGIRATTAIGVTTLILLAVPLGIADDGEAQRTTDQAHGMLVPPGPLLEQTPPVCHDLFETGNPYCVGSKARIYLGYIEPGQDLLTLDLTHYPGVPGPGLVGNGFSFHVDTPVDHYDRRFLEGSGRVQEELLTSGPHWLDLEWDHGAPTGWELSWTLCEGPECRSGI